MPENTNPQSGQNLPAVSQQQPVAQPVPEEKPQAYKLKSDQVESGGQSLLAKLLGKSAPVQTGSAPAQSSNAFTQLFGKQENGSSGQKQPASAPAARPSIASLIGPKPIFDRRLYEDQERHRAKTAKTILYFMFFIAVCVYVFFYSQLNSEFTLFADQLGPNAAARFERSNSELQKIQTDLNLMRYRTARLWLNEVNEKIDQFQRQGAILKSEVATKLEKQNASAQYKLVGETLKKDLVEVQKIFSRPFGIDTYTRWPITESERERMYEKLLLDALSKQKENLLSAQKQNNEEIRLVDNILNLVGNRQFRETIKSQDFGKISDDEFAALLDKIRAEATDELSEIEKVRKARPDWASVIRDIHEVTKKADPYYGQGLFKTVGGFLFNSYKFDSESGRVSITGLTKTSDSKTFSFIAKLVDSIEKSPKFKDIDFRSFSKSRDEEGDFSSSINLDFAIQNNN